MDAGKATLWRSDDGHTWSAMIMSEDAGRHSGGVAVNNAGIVAILIEPNSANVPDEQLVFVAHGSDVVSAIGAPVSVLDVVATPDQFIALARCQDAPGCTENYLLIGTPSEAAQVAAPTLPLP